MRKNITVSNWARIEGGEKISGFGIRLANGKRMFKFIFFNQDPEGDALEGVGILRLAHFLLSCNFRIAFLHVPEIRPSKEDFS